MTSTGNDIVALKAVDIARTKEFKFYSRIITSREEDYYDLHLIGLPLEHFVWLAWSAKESIYKYLKREYPELIFSPLKMNIFQLKMGYMVPSCDELEGQGFAYEHAFRGWIPSINGAFHLRSIITNDFIVTVVNRGNHFKNTCWGVKKINSNKPVDQSREVRDFLHKRLDKLFPGNKFRIEKSEYGWPVIIDGENELPIPVSFSHHDHYVAYSFQLKNKTIS